MIRHVVLRAFLDETTSAEVAAVERRTRGFIEIDGVRAVVTGPNLGLNAKDGGYTHLTVIDLDSEAALRTFIADPRHAAAASISGPLTDRVLILDVAV